MKHFLRLLLILFVYLSNNSALAAGEKVLFLTTVETDAAGIQIINNARAEFVNAGAVVTQQSVLSTAGGVTNATFTAADGGAYDVVLMVSVFNPIDLTNWTVINNAIATRQANSFVRELYT